VVHDQPNPKRAHQTAPFLTSGQILRFELRRPGVQVRRGSQIAPDKDDVEPIDDLASFEEEDRHVDYRHRMLMNLIALAIVTVLIGVGVWLADTIADMQKAQDCVMQGRQNCAPIEIPMRNSRGPLQGFN
jgi:hypothetical protein